RPGARKGAVEGRGAPGGARAQLIGLPVQVPDEREFRITQRSDLLCQAVDGLWIRDVAETALPVRRRRLVRIVGPAEWLAARIGPLRGAARRLRDLAHLRIVALRAGRERRVVPDLLVVRVGLRGPIAKGGAGDCPGRPGFSPPPASRSRPSTGTGSRCCTYRPSRR